MSLLNFPLQVDVLDLLELFRGKTLCGEVFIVLGVRGMSDVNAKKNGDEMIGKT